MPTEGQEGPQPEYKVPPSSEIPSYGQNTETSKGTEGLEISAVESFIGESKPGDPEFMVVADQADFLTAQGDLAMDNSVLNQTRVANIAETIRRRSTENPDYILALSEFSEGPLESAKYDIKKSYEEQVGVIYAQGDSVPPGVSENYDTFALGVGLSNEVRKRTAKLIAENRKNDPAEQYRYAHPYSGDKGPKLSSVDSYYRPPASVESARDKNPKDEKSASAEDEKEAKEPEADNTEAPKDLKDDEEISGIRATISKITRSNKSSDAEKTTDSVDSSKPPSLPEDPFKNDSKDKKPTEPIPPSAPPLPDNPFPGPQSK